MINDKLLLDILGSLRLKGEFDIGSLVTMIPLAIINRRQNIFDSEFTFFFFFFEILIHTH